MAFDQVANFAVSSIAVAPSPAISGTMLTVQTGDGDLFPTVPFNCTVWPPGVQPTEANAEIVRVTTVSGDIFTFTRAQEGTGIQAIAVGWQIAQTWTAKGVTDIQKQTGYTRPFALMGA